MPSEMTSKKKLLLARADDALAALNSDKWTDMPEDALQELCKHLGASVDIVIATVPPPGRNPKYDQYGGLIPYDLALLPGGVEDVDFLPVKQQTTEEERATWVWAHEICAKTWYEDDVTHLLYIRWADIRDLGEDAEPLTIEEWNGMTLVKVESFLNRWHPKDGFYHA